MTRETKVGLLVGLAFIIIVGILLSEPLSHSNDAQPAQLPVVGPNVRAGVTTPGSGQHPPVTMIDPGNVSPRQTVPTQFEVTSRSNSGNGGVISIGPSPRGSDLAPHGRSDIGITPPRRQTASNVVEERGGDRNSERYADRYGNRNEEYVPAGNGNGAVRLENGDQARGSIDIGSSLSNGGRAVRDARDSGIPGDLAREAGRMGEELVPFGGHGANNGGNRGGALPAGARQYVVVSGDNLSKIATKAYGNNSKACRDAIVQANPSLQQDPNKIVSGRTYVIPAMPGTSPAPVVGGGSGNSGATPPIRANLPTPPTGGNTASTPGYVYTVKESDSLWRIAKEQLGDGAAVAVIKELNKEVLGGSDQVRPNMKLRLPAKPVNN